MEINANVKKPEILSPAGNMEKLKSALLFGADAVYFAGKQFGMRAAADNFSMEEIEAACVYTHSQSKKLYLTVNVYAKEFEIASLKQYLKDIKNLADKPDALICSDIGIIALAKDIMPDIDIHISTQANTRNHLTCNAWHRLGASRVILSREISLEDIKVIRENVDKDIELEVFVHGAMCVSYSGRCLLSNYLISRDANSGMCAQPCRWNYYVVEEKRLNLPVPIEEDSSGTTLFTSRDLCMIDHVRELAESGVNSFKIEGRMKSAYYTASVTNAYRIALDNYCADPVNYVPDKKLRTEVESVSHREYDTGYFFESPSKDAKICTTPQYIREKAYLGICVGYEEDTGFALFEQRNKIILNSNVQLLSPCKTGTDIYVNELLNEKNEHIESAPHPFMIFKIKVPEKANAGDILRSV